MSEAEEHPRVDFSREEYAREVDWGWDRGQDHNREGCIHIEFFDCFVKFWVALIMILGVEEALGPFGLKFGSSDGYFARIEVPDYRYDSEDVPDWLSDDLEVEFGIDEALLLVLSEEEFCD